MASEPPSCFAVRATRSTLPRARLQGQRKICRLLILYGAQFGVRDRNGLMPLHYAAYMGHDRVCRLLVRKLQVWALRASA